MIAIEFLAALSAAIFLCMNVRAAVVFTRDYECPHGNVTHCYDCERRTGATFERHRHIDDLPTTKGDLLMRSLPAALIVKWWHSPLPSPRFVLPKSIDVEELQNVPGKIIRQDTWSNR